MPGAHAPPDPAWTPARQRGQHCPPQILPPTLRPHDQPRGDLRGSTPTRRRSSNTAFACPRRWTRKAPQAGANPIVGMRLIDEARHLPDRKIPAGSREGDLIIGQGGASACATLVERATPPDVATAHSPDSESRPGATRSPHQVASQAMHATWTKAGKWPVTSTFLRHRRGRVSSLTPTAWEEELAWLAGNKYLYIKLSPTNITFLYICIFYHLFSNVVYYYGYFMISSLYIFLYGMFVIFFYFSLYHFI